jgi:hypothetical protein
MVTITGRVFNGDTNTGLANIRVRVQADASRSTTTDANGRYSLQVEKGSTYKVYPDSDSYVFVPPHYSGVINRDATHDFEARSKRDWVLIYGRVTKGTSTPFPNLQMTLRIDRTRTIWTNANGEYSFVVRKGNGFLLKPYDTSYTYEPRDYIVGIADRDRQYNLQAYRK